MEEEEEVRICPLFYKWCQSVPFYPSVFLVAKGPLVGQQRKILPFYIPTRSDRMYCYTYVRLSLLLPLLLSLNFVRLEVRRARERERVKKAKSIAPVGLLISIRR